MNNVGLLTCGNADYSAFTMGVLDFFAEKRLSFPHIVSSQRTTLAVLSFISEQKGRSLALTQKEIGKRSGLMSWLGGSGDKKAENEVEDFNYKAYFASKTLHEFALTDCSSGKPKCLSERKSAKKLQTLALAAMGEPITSKEVLIGGVYYFNGSISDPLLLKRAAQMKYKKKLMILSEPLGEQKRFKQSVCSLYSLVFRWLPNFCSCVNCYNTLLDKQLSAAHQLEATGSLLIIRPETDFFHKDHTVEQLYRHGYEVAAQKYDEIMKFIGGEDVK